MELDFPQVLVVMFSVMAGLCIADRMFFTACICLATVGFLLTVVS